MNRRDWLLLTAASARGESLTPAQLQKSLFLLGERMPQAVQGDYYHFEPYNYGPFDAAIYHDADELAREGMMRVSRDSSGRWREYSITPDGLRRASELSAEAGRAVSDYLSAVVEWARSCTFQQLVRAIYKEFPKYRVNSIFKD